MLYALPPPPILGSAFHNLVSLVTELDIKLGKCQSLNGYLKYYRVSSHEVVGYVNGTIHVLSTKSPHKLAGVVLHTVHLLADADAMTLIEPAKRQSLIFWLLRREDVRVYAGEVVASFWYKFPEDVEEMVKQAVPHRFFYVADRAVLKILQHHQDGSTDVAALARLVAAAAGNGPLAGVEWLNHRTKFFDENLKEALVVELNEKLAASSLVEKVESPQTSPIHHSYPAVTSLDPIKELSSEVEGSLGDANNVNADSNGVKEEEDTQSVENQSTSSAFAGNTTNNFNNCRFYITNAFFNASDAKQMELLEADYDPDE